MEKQLKAYDIIIGEAIEPKQESVSEMIAMDMERKLLSCKQCGYIVLHQEPPHVCPICRAKREAFARLILA